MPTKSKIQDQTFLFTGTLTEFTRDEAEALVAAHGGKVLSGVSGKLNYLVVGEDAGSKLEKAKALGTVKILTEKEFLKMVPKGVSKPTGKAPGKKVAAKVAVKSAAKATSTKKDTSRADAITEVKIGNQIWMAKNLDVTHFRNGDPIPQIESDKEWKKAGKNRKPAWCYYNNDEKNGQKYGKLYNWFAIIDPRGLAPKGWHVPSDEEWDQLVKFLGGEKKAGKPMKSEQDWEASGNGSNSSGLSCLPGGQREGDGGFCNIHYYGNWWSSSEFNKSSAWTRPLSCVLDDASKIKFGLDAGLSIRCLKDNSAKGEINNEITANSKVKSNYIVFDFRCIDTKEINQDQLYTPVEKDNMFDGLEEDYHFIWSNLIDKLPVKEIERTKVCIKHEASKNESDYYYNIRILVECALNADELYNKYEDMFNKFSSDPDEFYMGNSFNYAFCDYNPKYSQDILNESKHLIDISSTDGMANKWVLGYTYEFFG